VSDLNQIYGFVYNKGTKKIHNVAPGESLIPDIWHPYDKNDFTNFFHGNGKFEPTSHRSLIISFNQLINLLISNCLYTPFDKISEDLIIGVLNELKEDISNYNYNLKNVLRMDVNKKSEFNTFLRGLGNNTNVTIGSVMGPLTSRESGPGRQVKASYEEGLYTNPLEFDYFSNSILCETLSAALHQISQAKTANDTPMFLINSQAELSSYYKEKLKTFIPIFLGYLKTFTQRAKFYIKYIELFEYGATSSSYNYRTDFAYVERRDRYTQDVVKQAILLRLSKMIQASQMSMCLEN
jgi:hypothetical protein